MERPQVHLKETLLFRIAGFFLLLSPFLNFLVSYAALPGGADHWQFKQIIASFMVATGMPWVLRISKFIVGLLMVRGKSSAWLPVLVILAVTIAYNFLTFSHDFQISKTQTLVSLVTNVLLFGFILRAEVRINRELEERVKTARAARATAPKQTNPASAIAAAEAVAMPVKKEIAGNPRPQREAKKIVDEIVPVAPSKAPVVHEVIFRKGTLVDFEGFGKFAEIIYCREDELWLRSTGELPHDITKREVILDSSDGKAHLRLKFHSQQGKEIIIFKSA